MAEGEILKDKISTGFQGTEQGFAVAVLVLAAMYLALALEFLGWSHLILGHLIVALMAMTATVELYAGRTDFTR